MNSKRLAKEFLSIIRSWLTTEQLQEIDRRNEASDDGACASHDFCDANQAMIDAMEKLGIADIQCTLVDGAWEIAKLEGFTVKSTEPADQNQLIGHLRTTIQQLQAELDKARRFETDARNWRFQQLFAADVEASIVDSCFSDAEGGSRVLLNDESDQKLGAEDFVPGVMIREVDGVKYKFSLASTVYKVKEVASVLVKS